MLGFGASALVVDQRCIEEPVLPVTSCRTHYDTRATGVALLTTGTALALGGAFLLILPGPRRQVAVTIGWKPPSTLGWAAGGAE